MFKKCFIVFNVCLMLLCFIPNANAASDNYALTIPKVTVGNNQTLGTLVIKEKNDFYPIEPGDRINILLPEGVTYTKKPTVGTVVYDQEYANENDLVSTTSDCIKFIDNQSVKDGVYFEVEYSDYNFLSVVMKTFENPYIRNDANAENEVHFKFNVDITNDANKDIKIEVDAPGTTILSEYITVARIVTTNSGGGGGSSSSSSNTSSKVTDKEQLETQQTEPTNENTDNTNIIETKFSIGSKEMLVNGNNIPINVAPEIKNGHTLVPLRALSEALGADVQWNSETQTITVIKQQDK